MTENILKMKTKTKFYKETKKKKNTKVHEKLNKGNYKHKRGHNITISLDFLNFYVAVFLLKRKDAIDINSI